MEQISKDTLCYYCFGCQGMLNEDFVGYKRPACFVLATSKEFFEKNYKGGYYYGKKK